MIVSTTELEKICCLSRQMLNKLARDGVLSKEAKGKWDIVKVLPEFIEYKIELATNPLIEKLELFEDANNPKARLQNASAAIKEAELLEKQKKLVPYDFAEKIVIEEVRLIRNNIYGIPNKVSIKMLRAQTKEEIKSILLRELDVVFMRYVDIPLEIITVGKNKKREKSNGK